MHDSKLFALLKAVKQNRREILEFEKFIRSPYFNSREDVIDLLMFVKKYWNASERQLAKKMSREAAFRAVYPEAKRYSSQKINECISNLSILLEGFFVEQELRENKRRQDILMADALKARGIDKYYFKKMEEIEGELNERKTSEKASNPALYDDLSWLNQHIYHHPNHHKHSSEENNLRLKNMMDNLDLNYVIKKLQYICEVCSRERVFGLTYTPRFLDEIIQMARDHAADNATLRAYLSIYDLFISQDSCQITPIKERIFDLIENSDVEFKLDLVIKLLNALPNTSDRLQLYFELYEYTLDKEILIEHNYIAPEHYANIIGLGCTLKKDRWVLDFIDKYTKYLKLEEDKLENIQCLFQALVSFYNRQYDLTFELLLKIKLEDVTYGLRYYTLLIMTMVEGKDEMEFRFDFSTHSKSFKSYINRKYKNFEISEPVKNGCRRFANISNKVYNWKFRQWNKGSLYQELKDYKEIPYDHWLRGLIDGLD